MIDPPIAEKGIHPKATKLNFQENTNPRTVPQINAKITSIIMASPSVLAPFNVCTSLARTDVRTPAAFSL